MTTKATTVDRKSLWLFGGILLLYIFVFLLLLLQVEAINIIAEKEYGISTNSFKTKVIQSLYSAISRFDWVLLLVAFSGWIVMITAKRSFFRNKES